MTPAVDSNVAFDAVVAAALPSPPFRCQQPGAAMPCYGPPQIRAAYDVQPLLDRGITGAGRTIVIVDAFQDPMLQSDIAAFDQIWGLPAADLTTVAPDGLTPFDPTSHLQIGWAREIAIDVEWAHVIAPGAKLELVLAKSEQDADIFSATRFAIAHNLGDVISMSFSEAESCPSAQFLADEHRAFERAAEKGITLVASSGDTGPAQHACDGALVAAAGTPASDPLVTAVGGTRLVADVTTGSYQSESGWGDRFGASGGGFSAVYRRPGYQAGFFESSRMRGLPDVAWSADAYGAVIAFALGGLGASFGTSAPTAEWAGVVALVDQAAGQRVGPLNRFLYRLGKSSLYHSVMHDVTSGGNAFAGFTGFSAGPGWDPVTGLGTPEVAKLLALVHGQREQSGGEGGDDGGGQSGGSEDSGGGGGG